MPDPSSGQAVVRAPNLSIDHVPIGLARTPCIEAASEWDGHFSFEAFTKWKT
jgi:hypothetical protein